VAYGIALFCLVTVVGYGLMIFPAMTSPSSLYPLALNAVSGFALLLIPLSFGFAMLRYRLWEIDVLINRTLVYGTLTAIVVGVYVLVVSILSTLLHTFGNFLISLLATGLVDPEYAAAHVWEFPHFVACHWPGRGPLSTTPRSSPAWRQSLDVWRAR